MAARVVELEVLDVQGLAYFQFRWEGDDWRGALEAIKAQIDPIGREYDPQTRLWRVSCAYEPVLCEIFPNFAGALDGIRSQMVLFGGVE